MDKLSNHDREKILQITQRLDFFRKFSAYEQRQVIGMRTTLVSFKAGEFLIHDNEKDRFFFILLSGSVTVSKGAGTPSFATLKAGEFFGEIAFLTGSARTANVVAEEVCIVLKLDKEMLERLDITIREKIKDKVIEKLVKRLDNMNNAFVNRWS